MLAEDWLKRCLARAHSYVLSHTVYTVLENSGI